MAVYKLICPGCGQQYSSESPHGRDCLRCGAAVVYTGFTKKEFDQKTPEEKQRITENVKNGLIVNKPKNDAGSGFWISLIDSWANFFIVLGCLASIFAAVACMENGSGWLGLVFFIVGVLLTLTLIASIKIFLAVAEDIRAIRSYCESKKR